MLAQPFTFFEVWYLPFIFSMFFLIKAVTTMFLAGDYFASNPIFEKKFTKYSLQTTEQTIPSFVFCAFLTNATLFFKNSNFWENFWAEKTLFIVFFIIFISLKTINNLNFKPKTTESEYQVGSTYGFYLFALIPSLLLILSATNLIDFLLPLEIFGLLFYFVIMESMEKKENSDLRVTNKVSTALKIRNFLYYFWLNFVGTVSFMLAIVTAFLKFPSLGLNHIQLFLSSEASHLPTVAIAGFILIGFSIKSGGMFFFFFKADLYKMLDNSGVLVFSVVASIFYILIFIYLGVKIPYFLWISKYALIGCTILITVYLAFVTGLDQPNLYVFFGLSTVLTLMFCLLVLI